MAKPAKFKSLDNLLESALLKSTDASNSFIAKRVLDSSPDETSYNNTDLKSYTEYVRRYRKRYIDSQLDDETTQAQYKNEQTHEASAVNPITGQIMTPSEYCDYYNLPEDKLTSSRFMTHKATPSYNMIFSEAKDTIEALDIESVLKDVIEGLDVQQKPANKYNPSENPEVGAQVTRVIYTDVHIGMDTNKDKNSMYAELWNKKAALESADEIIFKAKDIGSNSNILVLDELGDMLDGWSGQTTRGGHVLPQNMSNAEAFAVALEFKMRILEGVSSHFEYVYCHNICNDNHAGDFARVLNIAFKQLAEARFSNVIIRNFDNFINHYVLDKRVFILTHGKDDKALKFGFKPQLDTKQADKIDQYIKFNELYIKGNEKIEFCKGDSHQCLFDYSGSNDFNYMNMPALSPASQWVQTNFKRSERGFVVQNFNSWGGDVSQTVVILN